MHVRAGEGEEIFFWSLFFHLRRSFADLLGNLASTFFQEEELFFFGQAYSVCKLASLFFYQRSCLADLLDELAFFFIRGALQTYAARITLTTCIRQHASAYGSMRQHTCSSLRSSA
jgi:hypothetical protein